MVDSRKCPGKDPDHIDRNILNELQKDGRISNVGLSKRVGLLLTLCLERVRRLERQGFIQGYTALLDPHYLGASLLVSAEITLNRGVPGVFEQFDTAVQEPEEIQECHLVPDDFDYLLKTCVPDMSVYRKLLRETLLHLPGANDTRTYVIMEEVKQSNRLVIKTRQHGIGVKSAHFGYTPINPYSNSTGVTWYCCPFQHRAGKACNLESFS